MGDLKLDEGRIQFSAREEKEPEEKPTSGEKEGQEEKAQEERFAEEHPAGYLAAHLSKPDSRDAGFDQGRGVWGAPGEERASAPVHTRPMASRARGQTITERAGHPDTGDEPGYGAHGLERLGEDPRAFELSGGPPNGSVDAHLRDEIEMAIRQEPGLDAQQVQVTVHGREAFLTGTIPQRHMDELAEQVSQRVQGIRRVHNGLRLLRRPQAPVRIG